MSIGERILQKTAQKMHAAGQLGRQDMAIVDFTPIDDGKRFGHVLIEYDRESEAPDPSAIQAFFTQHFGNMVKPNLTTIRLYPDEAAVSLVCGTLSEVRPISDAADKEQMTMVNALAYADNATNTIWDVTQDESGRKYMVRHSEDNLTDIVEQRKRKLSRSGPKLASMGIGKIACAQGDHVKFYDNGVIAYGEVTSVSGNKVTVRAAGGAVTVDRGAILVVTQKSQGAMSDEKAELKDYFSQAYGDPGFAGELTKTTVKEENGGKITTY